MFVQVRCSSPGQTGRSRAGRRFDNGVTYRMEVIESALGEKDRDAHGNGPLGADGQPDMTRIDRAGLTRVKADPVMSVLEGGDTAAMLSQAAFDEARAQLKRANEQLADAQIANATLQAQVDDLTEQLADAQIAPAAPDAPAPDAPPAAEEPTGAAASGGKKSKK